jgi:radical SAM superfamily enzyme YgiQ (UPF0313 family)
MKLLGGHCPVLPAGADATVHNGLQINHFEFDVKSSFISSSDLEKSNKYFEEFCYQVAKKAISNDPDLISIGAFVWNEIHLQRIIKVLRNDLNFKNKILIGGPQVTYALPSTLEKFYPNVDFFIRGYAEDSFAKLILNQAEAKRSKSKPLVTIPGVHSFGDIDLGIQSKTLLQNLPSPFLNSVITLDRQFIRWESQRGCPFRCTFCQHRDSYSTRQAICSTRIEQEIEMICNKKLSLVNDIAVLDPTFNSGSNYLSVLDTFLRFNYTGKLALQTRLEMITEPFLDKVCMLNDQGARVVLECGIQTVINDEMKVIKRLNNLKKIERVVKNLHERRVEFEVSIIFGLPKQTLETFRTTVSYCQEVLKPKKLDAFPLMILRGTELEKSRLEYGLVEEMMPSSGYDLAKERIFEGIPHVTSSSSFTKEEWIKMFNISQNL